jgi:hypothetical protein
MATKEAIDQAEELAALKPKLEHARNSLRVSEAEANMYKLALAGVQENERQASQVAEGLRLEVDKLRGEVTAHASMLEDSRAEVVQLKQDVAQARETATLRPLLAEAHAASVEDVGTILRDAVSAASDTLRDLGAKASQPPATDLAGVKQQLRAIADSLPGPDEINLQARERGETVAADVQITVGALEQAVADALTRLSAS